jgi:hypothetical protein
VKLEVVEDVEETGGPPGVGATDAASGFADKPRCPGVLGTCAAADVAASFDVAESFDDVVVLSRGFGFLFNGGDCD